MLAAMFARRYLVSKKSHSVINLISVISGLAVSVPVAAMIILLSVFNGFEGLVKGMYSNFDPDVMVLPAKGKTFEVTEPLEARLAAVGEIAARSYIVEDNVMVEYRGGQSIATLRGVDSLYPGVVPVEKMMRNGEYKLRFGDIDQAVVGQGMAYGLGVNTALYDYIHFYAPRRGNVNPLFQIDSYRSEAALPAGTFALDAETDGKYIIAPIDLARRLLDYPGSATGIAIKLIPGADPDRAARAIGKALGDEFKALTRYEQKASLYRIMRYEKWGIFLIISLVLVIASFSVIGSLVMLVIEKKDDIRTIVTIGGTVTLLRSIFRREGMLICALGAGLGMLLGVGVCLLQQQFGIVTLPADTFLVESYPVIMQWEDIAGVAVLFTAVGYIIVNLTVARMIPRGSIRL